MKKGYIVLGIITVLMIIFMLFANSGTETEITLGKYLDIEVEIEEVKVTDKAIEDAIMEKIKATLEYEEVKNRTVRSEDLVNIDYVGKIDGEEFKGGTAEGHDLEIGSGKFIPGFEDQIIGMKIGTTANITVTFPEDYGNELAGKEAVFTVTINSISAKKVPSKITNAMIKELTSDAYKTVKEYKEYIKSELETEAEETNKQKKQNEVWKIIVENTTANSLSSKKIKYYSDLFENNYQYYADSYEISLSEFVETYMEKTMSDFNKEKKAYGEEATKNYGIATAIAKEQNISISNEEYQNYLDENNVSTDDEKQYKESIKDEMLLKKVIEIVTSKAKISTV